MNEDILKQYIKNDKNTIYKLGTGKLIQVTFSDIVKINDNNNVISPVEQIELDENKVNEICESYKNNRSYFISKCVITIGYMEDTDTNIYYIVDGQHRINSVIKLYLNDHINGTMLISLQKMMSLFDVTELFSELNKDSSKSNHFIMKNMKNKMKYIELKKQMENEWKGCYNNKKTTSGDFYSLSAMIKYLDENDYFNNFFSDTDENEDENIIISIENIIDDLNKKQILFFKE